MRLIFDQDGNAVSMLATTVGVPGSYAAPPGFDPANGACLINGVVRLYTAAEAARRADRPPGPLKWSNATMQWENPRQLASQKVDAWARIKAARRGADAAGFTHGGSTYQSDDESRARLQMEVMEAVQAGAGWSTTWVLADNTEVILTRAQMLSVGRALRDRLRANHAQARTLRAAIDAATSTAELEAITWPG